MSDTRGVKNHNSHSINKSRESKDHSDKNFLQREREFDSFDDGQDNNHNNRQKRTRDDYHSSLENAHSNKRARQNPTPQSRPNPPKNVYHNKGLTKYDGKKNFIELSKAPNSSHSYNKYIKIYTNTDKNVLRQYNLIDENTYPSVLNIAYHYAKILCQHDYFNFYNPKTKKIENHRKFNIGCAVLFNEQTQKKDLLLVISGKKTSEAFDDLSPVFDKISALFREKSSSPNEHVIAIQKIMENNHPFSGILHYADQASPVYLDFHKSFAKNYAYATGNDTGEYIYGCSEPALHDELQKLLIQEEHTIKGSVEYRIVIAKRKGQQILIECEPQASCIPQCQTYEKHNYYNNYARSTFNNPETLSPTRLSPLDWNNSDKLAQVNQSLAQLSTAIPILTNQLSQEPADIKQVNLQIEQQEQKIKRLNFLINLQNLIEKINEFNNHTLLIKKVEEASAHFIQNKNQVLLERKQLLIEYKQLIIRCNEAKQSVKEKKAYLLEQNQAKEVFDEIFENLNRLYLQCENVIKNNEELLSSLRQTIANLTKQKSMLTNNLEQEKHADGIKKIPLTEGKDKKYAEELLSFMSAISQKDSYNPAMQIQQLTQKITALEQECATVTETIKAEQNTLEQLEQKKYFCKEKLRELEQNKQEIDVSLSSLLKIRHELKDARERMMKKVYGTHGTAQQIQTLEKQLAEKTHEMSTLKNQIEEDLSQVKEMIRNFNSLKHAAEDEIGKKICPSFSEVTDLLNLSSPNLNEIEERLNNLKMELQDIGSTLKEGSKISSMQNEKEREQKINDQLQKKKEQFFENTKVTEEKLKKLQNEFDHLSERLFNQFFNQKDQQSEISFNNSSYGQDSQMLEALEEGEIRENTEVMSHYYNTAVLSSSCFTIFHKNTKTIEVVQKKETVTYAADGYEKNNNLKIS